MCTTACASSVQVARLLLELSGMQRLCCGPPASLVCQSSDDIKTSQRIRGVVQECYNGQTNAKAVWIGEGSRPSCRM
eukprot:2884540-Amphidinium_carterae.1